MDARKQKDIDLFNHWKATGSKESLSTLVHQLKPLIYSEVQRTSGTLPESALSAEAKKWAVHAINNFDPNRGVALSTHVTNYLQKVRRLNYKYQNAARLPENLHLQYSQFQTAAANLESELNREPTDEELAKKLGWKTKEVSKFKGQLYSDLAESATERPREVHQFNENKFLLDHIIDNLTAEEKYILMNAKDKSAEENARHLGVNIPRYNYLKAKLVKKIAEMKSEIGMY